MFGRISCLLCYGLHVSYREGCIPLQLSGMLRDRRSELSLHKQEGRCRSDNPALIAGSDCRRLRFQRRCSQLIYNSFTFTVNPLGTAKCAGHYGIAALIVLSFISLRYPSVQKLHLLFGMEPVLAVGHDGQLRPKAFRERGYGLLGGQIVPLAV